MAAIDIDVQMDEILSVLLSYRTQRNATLGWKQAVKVSKYTLSVKLTTFIVIGKYAVIVWVSVKRMKHSYEPMTLLG